MRVPLSWLRDYIDIELTPEQLAERLTLLGMEVKGLERWGGDWQEVVVGRLLSVGKHPNADRLSLTTVDVGAGEPLSIVCGATNIAPGQRVPVALPGATLPGGRAIERTEKMGVVSNGMLCSGDELGMTNDADGILILPTETPIGVQLVDLYGDTVLDVDVKPNRGDALSLVGLAREIAAATGAELRWPPTDVAEGGDRVDTRLTVDVRDNDLCPRFVGRWVAGVRVAPSPDRVQMRLLAAGMRPVSNVVDASNYVMLELGKPIHTFDAAAIARDDAGRAGLFVRLAEAHERLVTLDHVERELAPDTLLIADADGPLAIAGVMGGASSEVGDGTTDVVVESAIFDPISIRRTGQRYALRSEASLRFEKGQEFRLARVGADRTARLIADWAGGVAAPGHVDTAPVEPEPVTVAFRPARVNRLLGTSFDVAEQRAVLARVGVQTEPAPAGMRVVVAPEPRPVAVEAGDGEAVTAHVPTWRRDIAIEADIAEEIARVRGYELVPEILPDTPMPPARPSPLELRDLVRQTLVGAGLTEVVTHALVSPATVTQFPGHDVDGTPEVDRAVGAPITVTNPLSSQHSVLRQSLIGSLLDVVGGNQRRGRDDVAVFEVGKGYGREAGTTREWWRLGFALTGAAEPAAWNRETRAYDLDDAKGVIELLARTLGLPEPQFRPLTDDPNFHPGRAAIATVAASGGRSPLVGRVGELHPEVADAHELRGRVIVAELAVEGLAAGRPPTVRVEAPPRFPAVERDLAIVVDESVPAGRVTTVIREHAGPLLEHVALFDIYRGAPLGSEEKSLAFRLRLQAADRTLTEAEVDDAVGSITAALATDVSGRIRS